MNYYIKGLASYFPPANSLFLSAMRRGMKKSRSFKVRRYVARLIDLNEYFDSFLGATISDRIRATEFNEILLNSMPNIW